MCDIEKISRMKKKIDNSAEKVLEESSTNINQALKDFENLEKESQENLRKLFLLL